MKGLPNGYGLAAVANFNTKTVVGLAPGTETIVGTEGLPTYR